MAIILLVLAAAPPLALGSPVDIGRLRQSVVKIEIEGDAFEVVEDAVTLVPFLGEATGVVVGNGRMVLTASHVLAQTRTLRISSYGGEVVTGRPVAVDRETDIALLQLDDVLGDVRAADLSDEPPEVGMDVWVLGHPMGFEFSLTRGIVSALRPLDEMGVVGFRGQIIQLDAALNQGVSGGGFFDQRGRLVGIAGSIISRSGGFEGIGLGAALDAIRDVLAASPCVFLGIDATPLPRALAEMLGLPPQEGFLVQTVFPGGLAEKAGLRGGDTPVLLEDGPRLIGGDVILEIDGLAECREVCRKMAARSASEGLRRHEISLTIWRDGRRVSLSVARHESPHGNHSRLLDPR